MSMTTLPNASSDASNIRYPSLAALQAAHNGLLKRQRQEGDAPAFLAEVADFLREGAATGALLDADADRRTAQGLLDYWVARLYRSGEEPPDATLAEFDSALAPELPDELCPYLGLDAFREADGDKFFGRSELIGRLIERLADQRLLAIVGPSGSGKSSLVRAGLIPALKGGALPGSQDWNYLPTIVHGSDPLASLDRILRTENHPEGTQPRTEIDESVLGSPVLDSPCLLVVDQFEELFTLCEDDQVRQAFVAALREFIETPDAQHRLILTMRSDFETFIARAPDLQAPFNQGRVQVTPLSAAELREAIEQPAQAVGLKFQAGIVDALLQDILGEPAGLPLLQFTLLKLWEHRDHNRVTREIYEHVGGGRLALARCADEFYADLIPEEQVTARRILLRMIRPGEGLESTSSRIRREDLYRSGEDPGRVDRVLAKLIDTRLVRLTEGETREDTQIEVAHEALVRNWPTLVDWLEQEKVALAIRRRLEGRATEWLRLGQGSGGLLDEVELREAERWLMGPEAAYLGYEPVLPTFVKASQVAVNQATQEKEIARENKLRSARRYAIVLGILAVLAVLATGVALLQTSVAQRAAINAQQQRDIAQQQGAIAQAQEATAVVLRQTAEAQGATAVVLRQTADANVNAIATEAAVAQAAEATARAQSQVIDTQRLAFAARSQGEGSETGLLLAYEAADSNDNQSTRQSLIDLINQRPRLLSTLRAHENDPISNIDVVNSAEYSFDGSRIVTASNDRMVRIWDAATGALLKTLEGHIGLVNSASYSPDGSRIVSASWDDTVRVWDAASGNSIILPHDDFVNRAVFNVDGTLIATASRDTKARLWDAQTGQLIPNKIFVGHSGVLWDVAISSDGQRLATASNDQTARIWDIATTRRLVTLLGHTDRVRSIAFSPVDDRRVLTSSDDGSARIWDAESGVERRRMVASSGRMWNARWSPDGRRVVTASDDGTARIWDAESGVELAVFGRNSGRIWTAAYSPKGQQIVTAADQGVAQIWDAVNWGELPLFAGHTQPIVAAAYSADGKLIVTAADDVRTWDTTSGAPLRAPLRQFGNVLSIALSPDGQQAITAAADGTARIWDTVSGEIHATLGGHNAAIRHVEFSPNGNRIVTASDDKTARLWDRDGMLLATLSGHTAAVTSAAFSSDGARIVTGSSDGTARIWDERGKPLTTLQADPITISIVAFSPDGKYVVAAAANGSVWVWDATGQLHFTIQEPSEILSATFSADGGQVLVVWRDGTLRAFDRATHRLLTTIQRPTDVLTHAIFSPDRQRLLVILSNNTARQYLINTADLLAVAACRVGRGLTDEEIQRFQVPTPLKFDFSKRQCPPVLGN